MSYKVKFDTGETITFDKPPTDKDIEDVVKKLGIKPKNAVVPETKTATKKNTVGDVFTGIGKGLTSTVVGLGQLPLKAYSMTGLPGSELAKQSIQTGEDIKATQLKPENTAQAIGKGAEQIAEFLIPVGAEAKALGILQKLVPGIAKSTKVSAGMAKLLTKAVASGTEFGGKTLLQTGGDTNQAIDSALLGFIATPVMAGIGKVAKVVTKSLPERLYSQIFKTAEDDLMKYYQTTAKGGTVNPTLAKELLDKGLKGNSKNMAVYSIKKVQEIEQKVQEAITTGGLANKTIDVGNKKGFEGILNTVKTQFKNGFLSDRAKEADALLKELKTVKNNKVSVDLGLRLRRFVDRMRNTSSFKLDPKLTPRQEEFKTATDYLRGKLSDIGLKDFMNEERIFIEATESIVTDAAKRQNVKLLNLTDFILGGGGMASGFPGAGIGAAAGIRAFQQPFTLTNLGQILFKTGNAIESITPFLKQIPKTIPPLSNK